MTGITFAKAEISNPRKPRWSVIEIDFLIDTGESLGLMVNPVTREVLPTRLFLASNRRRPRFHQLTR